MRKPSAHEVDIAILGSGASGTHGLLQILSLLAERKSSLDDVIRITVIDRDEQFHSGIPYGHRSGRSSLLISALENFLPDRERSEFISWLEERREEMLSWAAEDLPPDSPLAQAIDRDWILRHEDEVRARRWDGLYLPRRLYGQYLAELVERAIDMTRGFVEVDFVHADVNEVIGDGHGGSHLRESTSDGEVRFSLHACSMLLAIGSPPLRQLAVTDGDSTVIDDHLATGFVDDIHIPAIEHVIERIKGRLMSLPIEKREILLVGGNADALEFLLASHRLRQDTGAGLTILSPQGRPHHWHHDRSVERAPTPIVDRLLESAATETPLRARELHAAVRAELAASVDHHSFKSKIEALIAEVGSSLAYMDDYELCSMATEHGRAISDLLRKAGGDAVDLLDEGISDGSIACVPGRFREALHLEGMLFADVDRPTASTLFPTVGAPNTPDHGYAVIINATGFERVTDTHSPLLRQMLGTGIVKPSASKAGLALDGSFRANPGIFVLGPLIAGHHHGSSALWHIESVVRIMQLAGKAAEELVTDTLSRRSSREQLITV